MSWMGFLADLKPVWLAERVKKWLRIRRCEISLPSGIRLRVDPVSHFGRAAMSAEGYEPELTALITHLLRAGDGFIDVGANEAYFSLLASRLVGPKGVVLAFEPQTRLTDAIRDNIRLNGSDNVRVFRKALGSAPGTANLFLSSSLNSGASSLLREATSTAEHEQVEVVRLDGFLEAIDVPTRQFRILKIDSEGFEGEVLAGAEALLRQRRIDIVCLDFHQRIVGEEKTISIDTEMRRQGYLLSEVDSGIWVYHLPEVAKDLQKTGALKPIAPFAQMYGKSSGRLQAQASTL